MLNFTIGGITCRFSLLFPAALLIMLYFDPTGVAVLGIAASVLHEIGHVTVMLLFKEAPHSLTFSFYGMQLQPKAENKLSSWQMALVTLGGPFVNLICAVAIYCFCAETVFMFVHIALAAVNLIPVKPLDGGQALHWLLVGAENTLFWQRVELFISTAAVCLLFSFGIAVWLFTGYNFSIAVMAFYVLLCNVFDKGN